MSVSLQALMLEAAARLGDATINPAVKDGFVSSVQAGSQNIAFRSQNFLLERDNHWTNAWAIFVTVASGANLWAGVPTTGNIEPRISAYTRSGGITLFAAMPANITAGDRFQAHQYAPSRVRAAVNNAITNVYPDVRRDVEDTSLTVAANTYGYAVPSNISNLHKVEVQIDVGTASYPYQEVDRRLWNLRLDRTGAAAVRTLQFFTALPAVGNIIRLSGDGPLGTLTQLTDTIPVLEFSPEYQMILEGAVTQLLNEDVRAAGYMSVDQIGKLLEVATANFERARSRHGYARAPIRFSSPRVRPSIGG